jgi:hypothetical protein
MPPPPSSKSDRTPPLEQLARILKALEERKAAVAQDLENAREALVQVANVNTTELTPALARAAKQAAELMHEKVVQQGAQ